MSQVLLATVGQTGGTLPLGPSAEDVASHVRRHMKGLAQLNDLIAQVGADFAEFEQVEPGYYRRTYYGSRFGKGINPSGCMTTAVTYLVG